MGKSRDLFIYIYIIQVFFLNRFFLLDGGWTTKSPADGNKSLSLPKSICSQEVISSCLGKDLSAWRKSPISGTDYSGRDHITVKDCFWIARLVKKHSFSVSELQTVCSVHVANDPSQVVSVYYVRDSGVVSVEVLDSQLPKHWTLCQQMGDSVILRLTEWAEGLYRAVKFAKMIIETSMSSQNLIKSLENLSLHKMLNILGRFSL